jgi:Type I phosphodiesterase / nucleotide pyrophosphatase
MMRVMLLMMCALLCLTAPAQAQPAPRESVVFVMIDGLRWQEVFRGADPALAATADYMHSQWATSARAEFVDVENRRAALTPFLTSTIATQGALIGNRDADSCAHVTNNMWFSYPGYNEALTGKADPRINSNEYEANPNVTMLEWLNRQRDFQGRVRAVTSWDAFPRIINAARSGVPVNAGFASLETADPAMRMLNRLQADTAHPWNVVRLDSFTHHIALDTLRRDHPRMLFISYGETDDFAHEGDYAQYLISAHRSDRFLREIWETLQADPAYAGHTTMFVTVDHGRGDQPGESWRHHSSPDALRASNPAMFARFPEGVPGSDQTWIAAIGPRVRAGGSLPSRTGACAGLNQLAATALTALGQDWRAYDRGMGAPLEIFLPQ